MVRGEPAKERKVKPLLREHHGRGHDGETGDAAGEIAGDCVTLPFRATDLTTATFDGAAADAHSRFALENIVADASTFYPAVRLVNAARVPMCARGCSAICCIRARNSSAASPSEIWSRA